MAKAAALPNPTVTVSDAGPSRKKLTIEIPAESVSSQVEESLETLMVEAQLPGFRKGRAPRRLIERRFGDTVRNETKSRLIADAYGKAVQEHSLKVIGDPVSPELDTIEFEMGKPFVFEVEVEVLPEFELPELKGIKVFKPLVEVTDEMVQSELDRICVNEGTLEERQAPEAGDYLTGRATMTLEDGTEIYDIRGAVVQTPPAEKQGRGMILGVMVEDLGKQLGLPKPGEKVTIVTTGPKNHELERVRNARLTMTFEVERVDRIVPASAEALASSLGYAGVDGLKDEIRSRLFDRSTVQQQVAMRQQITKRLAKSVTFDLPERLTARQAERNLERRKLELAYRGIDPQHVEEQVADMRNSSNETAARELKLFFIIHAIAEHLKVTVTEGEINGRIAQIAMSRGVRPEKLRQELIQSGQASSIYQQLREHKTLDALLADAEITEVSAEEYNRLVESESEDS
ncbi:MAG: trigger factor [Phycisphaeraceae bacterium]|nr:trigger factor [Phycisphaeraceae bacterium]